MKIVVVTLVHNKKEFLNDCFGAVQSIDYKDFVHLVVDNGSSDGATTECIKYCNRNTTNSVFIPMTKNIGQMPAYNYVLYKCKDILGYIPHIMIQVDADDLICSNAAGLVVEKFKANDLLGQTFSHFGIIDAKGNIKARAHPKSALVNISNENSIEGQKQLRRAHIRYNCIGHLRALRISSLVEIGGFDERWKYATDVNMACKMLSSRFVIEKIPNTLYFWREHGANQISSLVTQEQHNCWKEIVGFYSKKWKDEGKI